MNRLDLVLCLVIFFGALRGYREGFLMEVISFVAIVLGVLAGFKLMGFAIVAMEHYFKAEQQPVLPYIAFAVIFVLVVLAVSLFGRWIKHSLDKSFLGKVDQSLGAIMGLLKITFMISVVFWILDSLKIQLSESWVKNSSLYPVIAKFAPQISHWISSVIPLFKDIF